MQRQHTARAHEVVITPARQIVNKRFAAISGVRSFPPLNGHAGNEP